MNSDDFDQRLKDRITALSVFIVRTGASPKIWIALIDVLVETAVEYGRQLEKEGVKS